MRWALVTRWLLPSLLPLFPAIYLVVLAQGVLFVAALPDVPFWPGGVQRVIAYSISYGIFLWVLALVPAVVFLALVPAVGERIEPRWRALLTVGLAVTIGASALALLVALLTGGGFAAHFVLLAPIWILYGLLVQVPAGAPGRRAIRAALGGATLGALTLAIPFLGVGALLWAGLLIGDGRRVEAGWVLASAAVMPALLFATALA
ncbi:MAG TPA: hypothetical protein VHK06_08535, partial [Candidatus Limnocylindria bacterium]|nr:hypothetical protein [Candidatus Limnocylindria bacterium]